MSPNGARSPRQSSRISRASAANASLRENIAGKRVIVVDDSIVRGTTTRAMVRMLREAGPREVHLRVSSPPYRWPCYYGLDTGSRAQLIAANLEVSEICEYLGANSLAYLSLEALKEATGAPRAGFCDACLTGNYPVAIPSSVADGGVPVETGAWESAVAAGSLAIAHELLGVAQEMLDLAVAHVKERHQFGVPIGSFQAVQHRLADVLIDVTAGRAVCRTAWVDRDRFMSAAARAAAGRAFQTATVHCQQVLGAMGSTWEHPLHRYQRRGLLLDRLLDPAPTLRDALSAVVATQRRVEVLDR